MNAGAVHVDMQLVPSWSCILLQIVAKHVGRTRVVHCLLETRNQIVVIIKSFATGLVGKGSHRVDVVFVTVLLLILKLAQCRLLIAATFAFVAGIRHAGRHQAMHVDRVECDVGVAQRLPCALVVAQDIHQAVFVQRGHAVAGGLRTIDLKGKATRNPDQRLAAGQAGISTRNIFECRQRIQNNELAIVAAMAPSLEMECRPEFIAISNSVPRPCVSLVRS